MIHVNQCLAEMAARILNETCQGPVFTNQREALIALCLAVERLVRENSALSSENYSLSHDLDKLRKDLAIHQLALVDPANQGRAEQ